MWGSQSWATQIKERSHVQHEMLGDAAASEAAIQNTSHKTDGGDHSNNTFAV